MQALLYVLVLIVPCLADITGISYDKASMKERTSHAYVDGTYS